MLSLPLKLVAAKSRVITFLANLSAFTALTAFLLFNLLSCDEAIVYPPGYDCGDNDSIGVWKFLGLVNETVTAIAVHPQKPNVIFAGTGKDFSGGIPGRLYRSVDCGKTWQVLFEGVGHSQSVSQIEFDPNSSYNIWSMEISGNNKMQIIGGRMPHIRNKNIFYVGLYYEIYSYDLTTRVNKKETSFNLFYNDGIKLPIINDEETKFIFLANGKVGVFNLITSIYAILNETIAQNAVWYGNNKIILVILTGYKLNNGTIWIMNEDGSDKRQITHNYGLVLEGGDTNGQFIKVPSKASNPDYYT